ncbi:hypothetical protein ACX1HF_19565 [Yersinia pseudotuberculosis]
MKALDSFTVERLEEIIAEEGYSAMRTPKNDEVRALARIALAAKRAEPVYQFIMNTPEKDGFVEWVDCNQYFFNSVPSDQRRTLYTTPPLNHTAQDGWKLVPIEPTRQMMAQGHFNMGGTDRGKFMRIYQAMIAAAPEPQNQQQNIPEIIPQGWTSSDPANAALVMLDRIDTMDSADDDRIEDIKLIIRQLAAEPEKGNG